VQLLRGLLQHGEPDALNSTRSLDVEQHLAFAGLEYFGGVAFSPFIRWPARAFGASRISETTPSCLASMGKCGKGLGEQLPGHQAQEAAKQAAGPREHEEQRSGERAAHKGISLA
jgi:hypothetical protein